MDQSNRSNIFSTVFGDVNLAAATAEGLRAEARKAWFFGPQKVGPQFQLRLRSLLLATRKNWDYCKPRRAQTSNQKSMARWAPIWAPKLGPISGPHIWAPTLSQLGHCIEKKDRDLFRGPAWGPKKPTLQTSWGLSSKKRAAKRSWQTCRKLPTYLL